MAELTGRGMKVKNRDDTIGSDDQNEQATFEINEQNKINQSKINQNGANHNEQVEI